MTSYNSYYGPYLPSAVFARFVCGNAQYCQAHNYYHSTSETARTSFHKDVDPDEFARLLRLTRADIRPSVSGVPETATTLTINEQDPRFNFKLTRTAMFFYLKEDV